MRCGSGRHRATAARRAAAPLAALTAALLGASCTGGPARPAWLMVLEPPFRDAVTIGDGGLTTRLQQAAREAGVTLQLEVTSTEQPRAELESLLAERRPAGVVLAPLLAFEASELAESHPDVRFVLLQWTTASPNADDAEPLPAGTSGVGAPAAPPAPNVTVVAFARREAYHRAGQLVAAHLDAQGAGLRAGTIAAADSPHAALTEAFTVGFTELVAADRLLSRELRPAGDRVRLRRVIEGMARDRAATVLLDVGGLTDQALDKLAEEQLLGVVPNWGRRPDRRQALLLSIDDDLSAALTAGLSAAGGTRVAAPVRVVWRASAPPPTGLDLHDRVARPDGS